MENKVLVTGADQHQSLAVIRGLGLKGISVVAGSDKKVNIGFLSRYASKTVVYTSPHVDHEQFIADILEAVQENQVSMIIPAIESTMVALDAYRDRIEAVCTLAAPDSNQLELTIDKLRTVELALKTGVPVPKTICTDDLNTAMEAAQSFRFPVALKPRGNSLHARTRNQLGFKVRYANDYADLAKQLNDFHSNGVLPMIQEYSSGVGVCVSALFDRGKPIVMFPYRRLREVPLTGGVSVVRQGLILDDQLQSHVQKLLGELKWHGIAMVEFKYDDAKDSYVLMEINGRFQASTALSLDSGINFPYMVYSLYAGLPVAIAPAPYRPGRIERWLRGDMHALIKHLMGETMADAVPEARQLLPSRWQATKCFLKDFRPGVHFDEFKWYDPMPGLYEAFGCSKIIFDLFLRGLRKSARMAISAFRGRLQ